jgi:hypothetical protein
MVHYPQPSKPVYMSKEQQEYSAMVLEQLFSMGLLVFEFIEKYDIIDTRMVSLDALENQSCMIALRHLSYEKAVDNFGKSLETKLTRHFMHIIEEEKRKTFFDDAQMLLNQVYEMRSKLPAGLDDLPPRIVIRRIPSDQTD